jgi:PAS domain S-box-containing protein
MSSRPGMTGPLGPWVTELPPLARGALVRRFLAIWLPAVAALLGLTLLVHGQRVKADRRVLENDLETHLATAAVNAATELEAVRIDLRAMADLEEVHHLLEHDTPEMRQELAGDWVSVGRSAGRYARIALLDLESRERVAVRFASGAPERVPADSLRSMDGDPLVRAALVAERGTVLAAPYTPAGGDSSVGRATLRVIEPLYDRAGARRGAIYAEARASRLLGALRASLRTAPADRFELLDGRGQRVFGALGRPAPGAAAAPRTLDVLRPDVWARVVGVEHGALRLREGALFFATLHPPAQADGGAGLAGWKIVTLLPNGQATELARAGLYAMFALDTTLALLLAVGALLLARAQLRRDRAEAIALARLALVERLIDTIPNPIFFKDAAGRYRAVNGAYERLVGLEAGRILGRTVEQIVTGRLAEASRAEDDELLRRPAQRIHEGPITLPDGTVREIVSSKSSFLGADGAMAGIVGVILDITERKRAEADRERLIAELQAALASVKRLSGLIPICASCKKIRDDQGFWQQVEVYVRERSDADFSHGICPDCMGRLYPGLEH